VDQIRRVLMAPEDPVDQEGSGGSGGPEWIWRIRVAPKPPGGPH
jgi:hypothetical protein